MVAMPFGALCDVGVLLDPVVGGSAARSVSISFSRAFARV